MTPVLLSPIEALAKVKDATNPELMNHLFKNSQVFQKLLPSKAEEGTDKEFFKEIVEGVHKDSLSTMMTFKSMADIPDDDRPDLLKRIVIKTMENYEEVVSHCKLMYLRPSLLIDPTGSRMPRFHRSFETDLSRSSQAQDFKKMNQPAPEGTVSEIAEKYGISKSEVRRLKKEGRLQELTNN